MRNKKLITYLLEHLSSSFFGCNYAPEKNKQVVQGDSSQIYALREISPDSIQAKGLISIKEAKLILEQNPKTILFEVSSKAKYASGHLENATSVWRPDYETKANLLYGGMCAVKGEMEYFLSNKGVLPIDNIIIYDTKGGCDALRLAWILKSYGHEKVQIVNGGKTAWEKANFCLTQDVPIIVKKTNYKFNKQPKETDVVNLEEMKRAITDSNIVILDVREPEEYLGQPYIAKGKLNTWKKGAFTYGCIPSAVHLNWSEAVQLDGDHRFKCLKDLKYNFLKAGVTPDKEILVYCQSGVRSAHTVYVLKEILNYPNVKNYDGSWIEWSYNYTAKQNVPIQRHTNEVEYKALFADLKGTIENKY